MLWGPVYTPKSTEWNFAEEFERKLSKLHTNQFFPTFLRENIVFNHLENVLATANVDTGIPFCRERNSTHPVQILSENIHWFKSYDVHHA